MSKREIWIGPLSSRMARVEVDEEIHTIAEEMLTQPNAVRYSTFYNYLSTD
jgi:hypothetical protein